MLFVLIFRHRKVDDDEMSGGAKCCFGFLVTIAQILLHGALGLVLYWVFMFHRKEGATWPFAWREDPQTEFNLHPVLMIAGFIYFMGQGMSWVLFLHSQWSVTRIENCMGTMLVHASASVAILACKKREEWNGGGWPVELTTLFPASCTVWKLWQFPIELKWYVWCFQPCWCIEHVDVVKELEPSLCTQFFTCWLSHA